MLPPMEEVYAGRSIFITGASGFVGKVLIEKLLRSLPGIATIFVLVRPLRGSTSVLRWQDIENVNDFITSFFLSHLPLMSVLFNQLRRTFPQRLRKVVVIEGDISEDDFGISEENLKRVLSETSVVFHCAATVRFDEKLKKAADLNIRGVRRMVSLCQRMPKLDAFLHCSTAFANSDKPGSNITETLHPIDCDAHKLLTALENLEDSQINLIAGDLIKNHPNLYCFTKLLGEQLIVRDASNLPALIFRPSIISPVWKDGIPGWSDAFQGLTAMLGARYSGAIPRYPMHSVNPKTIMDCVPIDVVTSMMIVCTGHRMCFDNDSIPVYHCCTTDFNPLSLQILANIGQKYAMQYPTERLLSPPSFTLRGFPAIESYRHKFRATYVGPAMDGFSSILRQPPMWTKIYNKLRSAYEALIPFAQFYHFESPSIDKLKAMMTDDDKKIFDFDVRKIKWDDYGCDLIMGMKTFLMKDDVVDAHKIRLAKMNLLSHQLMGLLPLYAICYFISEVVTGSFSSWQIFLPLIIVVTLFTLKEWVTCTKIKSLDDYRDKIESIMGEPVSSMKPKKHIV